jgi:hypothetical protein
LGTYWAAIWFNLADEAYERALHVSALLNCRHLLENHDREAIVFAKVEELLLVNGLTQCGTKRAYRNTPLTELTGGANL